MTLITSRASCDAKNTLSKNTLSWNTLSDNTLSENTLLENTLSENTLLENTHSENTQVVSWIRGDIILKGPGNLSCQEIISTECGTLWLWLDEFQTLTSLNFA